MEVIETILIKFSFFEKIFNYIGKLRGAGVCSTLIGNKILVNNFALDV